MARSRGWRQPRKLAAAAALFLASALSACQHAPTTDDPKPSTPWRVMERIGDVRLVAETGLANTPLAPGDMIIDGRDVTAGNGALLILARDDMQLTLGENTSLRLADPTTRVGLFLDRGWLRVRLAAAANRWARIKTPHFDISASHGTLTLRTVLDETRLSVESGSAVLATPDGRHRATLVAGAAAKIDQGSGSDLFIQPASGQAFTKVSPLPAKTRDHDSDDVSSRSKSRQDVLVEGKEAQPDLAHPFPPALGGNRDVIVRPASRNNADQREMKPSLQPIDANDIRPSVLNAPPASVAPAMKSIEPPSQSKVVGSFLSRDVTDRGRDKPMAEPPWSFNPVRLNFDRLTEGLLDGL